MAMLDSDRKVGIPGESTRPDRRPVTAQELPTPIRMARRPAFPSVGPTLVGRPTCRVHVTCSTLVPDWEARLGERPLDDLETPRHVRPGQAGRTPTALPPARAPGVRGARPDPQPLGAAMAHPGPRPRPPARSTPTRSPGPPMLQRSRPFRPWRRPRRAHRAWSGRPGRAPGPGRGAPAWTCSRPTVSCSPCC